MKNSPVPNNSKVYNFTTEHPYKKKNHITIKEIGHVVQCKIKEGKAKLYIQLF